MLPDSWRQILGEPGTVAFIAVIVGGILRLIRTEKFSGILDKFGVKIPAHWIPWLALGLGALLEYLEKRSQGQAASLHDVAKAILEGMFAGAFAIAGHQTLVKTPERVAELRKSLAPKDSPASDAKKDDEKPPS